jgi:2-polyprenyl-6-hydroxyphenyl methylase/3-demethylubiquinone-9 3-methyltransferase
MSNVDAQELAKFSELAHRWWDRTASSGRCTRSTRCGWTGSTLARCGQAHLDVGCGGGILAEAMAQRGAT